MLSNKIFSRLFLAAAAVVSVVGVNASAQREADVVAPGVTCSDGNRQMCEKIITQTGEAYRYYI